MEKRENCYQGQLDMLENAMRRECAPSENKTGFWYGMEKRRDEMKSEFINLRDQLHVLIESGAADECAKHEYLDICDAIGE